jgi:hypothetical protein
MIERIEALCKAATPGPWVERARSEDQFFNVLAPEQGIDSLVCSNAYEIDATFIARARQLLPLMLEVVKAEGWYTPTQSGAAALYRVLDARAALDAYCTEHLEPVQNLEQEEKK